MNVNSKVWTLYSLVYSGFCLWDSLRGGTFHYDTGTCNLSRKKGINILAVS